MTRLTGHAILRSKVRHKMQRNSRMNGHIGFKLCVNLVHRQYNVLNAYIVKRSKVKVTRSTWLSDCVSVLLSIQYGNNNKGLKNNNINNNRQ